TLLHSIGHLPQHRDVIARHGSHGKRAGRARQSPEDCVEFRGAYWSFAHQPCGDLPEEKVQIAEGSSIGPAPQIAVSLFELVIGLVPKTVTERQHVFLDEKEQRHVCRRRFVGDRRGGLVAAKERSQRGHVPNDAFGSVTNHYLLARRQVGPVVLHLQTDRQFCSVQTVRVHNFLKRRMQVHHFHGFFDFFDGRFHLCPLSLWTWRGEAMPGCVSAKRASAKV